MNRSEIYDLAHRSDLYIDPEYSKRHLEKLVLFAHFVATAEREACAKLCESYTDGNGNENVKGSQFAMRIRQRGKNE